MSSNPIAPAAIDHIVLRVRDIDAMIAFYTGVLGCIVDRVNEELGLYQLRAGEALIDMIPVDGKLGARGGPPPGDTARNLDHFCLVLASFDEAAIRAHLAAHGVDIGAAGERYGARGMGQSLYIVDPEGSEIELKAP